MKKCKTCKKKFKEKWGKANKYCCQPCYWDDMPNRKGPESSAWKSNDLLGYHGVHKWLKREHGKAFKCIFCRGSGSRFEWANISGQYLRNVNDWLQLCHKCHNRWDHNGPKAARSRKNQTANLYAVDFDSVLCKRDGFPRTSSFFNDPPVEGAREAVEYIWSIGHECYVLTARPSRYWKEIVVWLYHYGFPGMQVTNVKKPGTTLWIDDRAYRFTNWLDIIKLIK